MGDKGVNEVFAGIFSIFGEFIHQNQNWDLCPQNQVDSMEGEGTIIYYWVPFRILPRNFVDTFTGDVQMWQLST